MFGIVDSQTYFIGHSMGCQAIARYLESLLENTVIGGAVFVSGFFKRLTNLEDNKVVHSVSDEWLKAPINLEKVKSRLNKSVAIFSDNDPYVPLDNINDFQNNLKSEIIIKKSQGHFSGSNGIKILPIALESLIKISHH